MECAKAREHLVDLERERLDAETAAALRAHVDGCPECAAALEAQVQVRALLQAELPRYRAPAGLRVRIQASAVRSGAAGWRAWWRGPRSRPWMVGSLVGALVIVLLAWAGLQRLRPDPTAELLAQAVGEHAEYASATMHRSTPDPQVVLGALRPRADFPLPPLFSGDAQEQLVAGAVSQVSGRRAATLVYRDSAGHYTTLFLMPDRGIDMPEGGRLTIQTYRPYHCVLSDHQVLLWKQAGLACVLVSDLDETGLVRLFLKIRQAP